MADNSKIEWTDSTWNPLRARLKADVPCPTKADPLRVIPAGKWGYHCERISPGCKICYACVGNGRTLPAWGTGLDYTVPNREKVEIFLDQDELLKPLRWKRGRKVFVCSMTDLFGEWVPDELIDRVFAMMALCCPPGCSRHFNLDEHPQHTFQALTKRAARMRKYFAELDTRRDGCLPPRILDACLDVLRLRPNDSRNMSWDLPAWPLPNVHLGVSVEDQQRANERIPLLLQAPAAVRFLSIEPLLGEVDLTPWLRTVIPGWCASCSPLQACPQHTRHELDWVIVGGESGPGARPMHPDWPRSIRDQCVAAGVPFFFKQWGEWLPAMEDGARLASGQALNCGNEPIRIGKKRAGRLLDGREWNEMPEARP